MNFNLYLIRHGQSVINEDEDAAGQDSRTPLSKVGEEQARLLGNYLSELLQAKALELLKSLKRSQRSFRALDIFFSYH